MIYFSPLVYTVTISGSLTSLVLAILSTPSTQSILLPLCPPFDCLPCILFQHPQQHSLTLQGLYSWCKVNHTGGREDDKRVHERDCMLPFCPLGNMVKTLHGCEKRNYVFNISTLPSAHGHVTLNSTNSFWHKKQACPSSTFCWMSHKTNLISTN